MKKKSFAAVAAVTAAVFAATIIASAGSDEKTVEALIDERTDTLNGYYDSGMSREEARAKIKEVETGGLLEQDLDNIDRYFQTDIDRIKDYEVTRVKITESDKDMICADVYIRWDVETIHGNDSFMCDYSVICVKEKGSYKLAQFF